MCGRLPAKQERSNAIVSGRRLGLALAAVALSANPVPAQWSSQTIRLRPGWNAVFLEVQPEPDSAETALADLPIESVWAWNRTFETVQYIIDPASLVPEQPEWLTYFPPERPESALTNLFGLRGGRAYLIKLAGTSPVDWVVTGQPVYRRIDWMRDSYNLAGFYVGEEDPPTFSEFFAPSTAHRDLNIYRLSAAGRWQKVASPGVETVRRGEAYWVYSSAPSDYTGPVTVDFEQGQSVDFSSFLNETVLQIRNESTAPRTVSLRPRSSAFPPASADARAVAGEVPLAYYKFPPENNEAGWMDFPPELILQLAPGERIELRLAVRRSEMNDPFTSAPSPSASANPIKADGLFVRQGAGVFHTLSITGNGRGSVRVNGVDALLPFTGQFAEGSRVQVEAIPAGGNVFLRWLGDVRGAGNPVEVLMNARRDLVANFEPAPTGEERSLLFQSLIEVSEADGGLIIVPVASEGMGTERNDPNRSIFAGLWVGFVSVTAVSEPSQERITGFPVPLQPDDAATLATPTGSEFRFRLLIHVDRQGAARLLQQVTQMFKPATETEPAKFVLVTDDDLLSQFEGSNLIDGEVVGRRISSAAFPLIDPVLMDSDSQGFNQTLRFTIDIPMDDPVNPFVHQFHPDHDNLNSSFQPFNDDPATPEDEREIESWRIVRKLLLEFSASDPLGITNPNWGDKEVGGPYSELISGIHKRDLLVRGEFRLRRVSSVDELNGSF